MSKEARGFVRIGGDCAGRLVDGGRVEACSDMERSEVGVESSIAEGWLAA